MQGDPTAMKFWHGNKLDAEAEYRPAEVARKFVAACREGWEGLETTRPSMEWTFRWWLTDPNGFNAVWDEAASDQLMQALAETLTDDDRDFIWSRIDG